MDAPETLAPHPAPAIRPRPAQPRAEGEVRLAIKRRGAVSAIGGFRQSGSAKALFPRRSGPALDIALLNTAGGVTGGDGFRWSVAAGAGARATVTTQAAERAYCAQPGETGRIDVALDLAAGARIDWIPQETILFDRSSIRRRIEVDMAADAECLLLESLIFGRAAMGERLETVALRDDWRIRRAGALIHADAFRLIRRGDAAPDPLSRYGAVASAVLAAPRAEDRLEPLRAALDRVPAATSGASARDGLLTLRIAAPDGLTLRRALIPALAAIRGAPAPKTWTI